MALSKNTLAPAFTAKLHTGDIFDISNTDSKYTVLYFYPKDDTSGCTAQACDLRDNKAEVEKYDAKIYGISKDPLKSHIKFSDKYNLNFPLIVDDKAEICTLYDVMAEKSMYGRKYWGIVRTTYIIDDKQTIVAIMENVDPKTHLQDLLVILKNLQ